jgi:hypothetical protein
MDKHSSLSQKFVNYGEKKFYINGPGHHRRPLLLPGGRTRIRPDQPRANPLDHQGVELAAGLHLIELF